MGESRRLRTSRSAKPEGFANLPQVENRGSPGAHLPPKSPTPPGKGFSRSPLPSPSSRLSPRLLATPSRAENPPVESPPGRPTAQGVDASSREGTRKESSDSDEDERPRRWSDVGAPRGSRRTTRETVPSAVGGEWEVTAHALKLKLAGAEKLVEGANKLAARLFEEAVGNRVKALSRSPSAGNTPREDSPRITPRGQSPGHGAYSPAALEMRKHRPTKTISSPQILTPEQQQELMRSHLQQSFEASGLHQSGSEGDLRRLKARNAVAGSGLIVADDRGDGEPAQRLRASLGRVRRKSSGLNLIRKESLANRDTYSAQIERMREEFKATREVKNEAVRSLRGSAYSVLGVDEWNRGPLMSKPRPLSARSTTIKLPPILGDKHPIKGPINGN